MKPHGSGSITARPDGRFWARAPDRKRTSLGLYETEALAQEAIDGWRLARAARGQTPRGDTFAEFGARVMDARELDGIRGIRQERSRWGYHLATSSMAGKRVAEIQPGDVQTFVRELARKNVPGTRRKIDGSTIRRCLSLASRVFDEAVVQGCRTDNPTTRIKVKRTPRTEEPWDYLRLEEQEAIAGCADVPEWARLLMAFALGTGLRQGEQWNLELRDLHLEGEDPHVIVRFGSRGQAPKNGRIRRVELFGDGLAAARRWVLAVLPHYAPSNPHRLVFPTVTGCRRGIGAPERGMTNAEMRTAGVKKRGKVELLPEWLRQAGVTREVRWHDLRHTCASSLVAGWWGRTWTLQEVCGMLGHSSIIVTQRYAHLGETSQKLAARGTNGHVRDHQGGPQTLVPHADIPSSHIPVDGTRSWDEPRVLAEKVPARDRAPELDPRNGGLHPGLPDPGRLAVSVGPSGVEPETNGLKGRCSAIELGAPVTGYAPGVGTEIMSSLPPEILNIIQGLISLHTPDVARGLKDRKEPGHLPTLSHASNQTVPTRRTRTK